MDEGKSIYGKVNLAQVVAEIPPDPDTAARHRAEILIKTDTIRVVLITILEGGQLNDHSAPGPITIHALTGSIDVDVEGERHTISAGEMISLAPGVRHAVTGRETGAFLLTIGVMTRVPDPGGHHHQADANG
jgi:quercetin dioxygenase-like cupin family protein